MSRDTMDHLGYELCDKAQRYEAQLHMAKLRDVLGGTRREDESSLSEAPMS